VAAWRVSRGRVPALALSALAAALLFSALDPGRLPLVSLQPGE